jgi:hypothetical protein
MRRDPTVVEPIQRIPYRTIAEVGLANSGPETDRKKKRVGQVGSEAATLRSGAWRFWRAIR